MQVVVVGGGAIGCSTAFALARRGAGVVVEDHPDASAFRLPAAHSSGVQQAT